MEEEVKETPEIERSEAELDALADSDVKASNSERAMSAPKEEKPIEKTPEGFEFTHNGKTVKATREQIIKWASQGYNYPQLVQKLNQDRTKWQEERGEWEKQWGIYRKIDDFARQNQDWWNFIQSQWQSRGAQPTTTAPGAAPSGTPDPYATKFQTLEEKLSQIEPLLGQLAEDRRLAHERSEDEKLDQEIKSIREQNPNLDWEALDENGKSLELRVLEHAQQSGISTFRAAFRDLLHDELLQKAQANGKIAVSRGIQQRTKLGVLGETPTPSQRMPERNRDIRKTSYEDLEAEIRDELRMGRLR